VTTPAAPHRHFHLGTARRLARLARAAARKRSTPHRGGSGRRQTDGSLKHTTDPASSVSTFLIAFGNGREPQAANWIAWGVRARRAWSKPAASRQHRHQLDRARPGCRCAQLCATCEDAHHGHDHDELEAALQAAIDKGRRSASSRPRARAASPTPCSNTWPSPVRSTPRARSRVYSSSLPVTVRSTFKMPNFEGQLKAYNSRAPSSGTRGQAEDERLDVIGTDRWSFAELTAARRRRRITFPPRRPRSGAASSRRRGTA
jgi:hypothetical protein